MGRLKTWRYDPPVTKEERVALQSEFWVMALLVAIMLLATFAEPLADVLCNALGVR
jgi:lipid-A-disaccharide synthase-like uncharacterized protein